MAVSDNIAPSPWSYIRKLMSPPWRGWVRSRAPYLASLVLLSVLLGSLMVMERFLGRRAEPQPRQPALQEEPSPGLPDGTASSGLVTGPTVPAGPTVPTGSPARPVPEEPLRPVDGKVTKGYGWGYSATLGDYRFHTGVDLAAKPGEEVRAAAGGKVLFAGANDETGVTVLVGQEDGKQTLYGNLGTAAVREGQQVRQGDLVGTVGSSLAQESADPSHLHFEILAGSEPVNPGLD